MATKATESNSIVGKEGDHHSPVGETTEHVFQPSYSPNGPLTDALARNVFLKFDLVLVLPILIMFCGCQYEYC